MFKKRTSEEEKIYKILERLFGSEKYAEVWLNTPHPDLGDKTPRFCINEGSAETILEMLESALEGQFT